ncbi:MAG: Oxidoreductase FAD/NAD(P)-binding domain protein [Candidatus Roizmanbacteria bacterium GW2011_GWC2_37_13]|uniref:Oxidoreductase FAD/NAD(P)-binding domain protein n=1 Tax=Candidatus Roizmanbacteria bacterium GW2011_GWC2_37_13 TaxID=1618486 RepID=A0A0G0G5I7_9BACT|nr:MAG: Oxidoreductase FAD/NAD(P)-binding domain protein [Candidatus Roizmanbacteria bacterium GW2011_GWC1_37_12]KKQ25297.1 MAG: Oxidoreductase FAD/NAD(P)-binding domain protein [Candidatus Roizmanbacteria bacterium GW2011_GWC2_37_13]
MIKNYQTILTNKKQLVNNIYFFKFKLIEPLEISFIPGQYLILKVQGKPRLYSIASSSLEKNTLEFIIELFPGGLASTYLDKLKIGEEVIFHGPAGQFKLRENDKQKIFLVTGTGIAPVRSMLKSTLDIGGLKLDKEVGNLMLEDQSSNFQSQNPASNFQHQTSIFLFWGLKTYKDVYLFDELKEFNLKICLSRESNLNMILEPDRQYFDLGHVDQVMERQLANYRLQITDYEFYLCGGRNVVESLRQNLLSKNIPQEYIYFEKF